MLKTFIKFAASAALFTCVGFPGYAQNTTQGGISGTVFDVTNAAVPNASVVIRNDGTNAEVKLTTDSSGFYKAPQLAPGTYTVTISAPGFGELKSNGVVVEVNQVSEVSPHLTTGSESTVVEVNAEIPAINLDSPDFGGHLSSGEIENIPINNRRWSSLALTTPAVTNDANGFGLLSFRAISAVLNNVQIDGADDNQAFFSEERGRTRAGYSTAQSAVREFQVATGVYSAELGRAVGGVVNSVTKSGTNSLHGEAFFYNRNSSRSAFQPGATNTTFNATTNAYVTSPFRPKDNRNQYGFGVGGPIIKDKLFFFYAFDAYRRNFPGTAKANNPNLFFVGPDAAFTGTQACNVKTGLVTGAATIGVVASAANAPVCLLAGRLTAVGTPTTFAQASTAYNNQLQAFLPDLGSVPRFGNQLINTPKLDYQLTPKHHVSALYHRLRWDSPGGVQTQGTNNYAIDTFGTDFVKLDYGLAKLDSLFGTHSTNELRYQYGRELNDEGSQPASAYTKANLIQSNGGTPEIALNSGSTGTGFFLGSPYYSYRVSYPDERKWQISDTFSILFGKHNLRIGTDNVHNYDLQNNVFEGNGFISYNNTVNYITDLLLKNNTAAGGRSCDSTGNKVGSGAVGGAGFYPCYSFYAQGFGPSVFDLSTMDYSAFVQDDWKIAPHLTLNLGVRYDYESIPAPYTSLSGAAGNTLALTTSHPSDKNNIAPRFGFAWDPYGLGKTVVRGGFGLYYGRIPNSTLLNAYQNTGSANSQSTPSYNSTSVRADLLPTLLTAPKGPAVGTKTAFYLDPHLQNPYTEQVDLAVQQNLGFSNVLSVSYLGAFGRELPNFSNANLDPTQTYTIPYTVAPAAGTSNCGPLACGQTYTVLGYAGRKQTSTPPGSPTYQSVARIDPAYGSITQVLSNINSSFNALSVDITNRSFKMLTFDANYTWAHALDFSQNQFTSASTNNFLDPYSNQRTNYGNSSLNVRHRAVGWAIFNVPGLSGHSPLTYATNGWSIKPLVQIQSGLPYSAGFSGTTPAQCNGFGCLQPASSGITGTGASSAYIPFIGRNTYNLPRIILVDGRVQKTFAITERYGLDLFVEGFNLANHRNVTGVNNSAFVSATSQATTPGATVNTLTYTPALFGKVTTANSNYAYGPRTVQLGARVNF